MWSCVEAIWTGSIHIAMETIGLVKLGDQTCRAGGRADLTYEHVVKMQI